MERIKKTTDICPVLVFLWWKKERSYGKTKKGRKDFKY
jgi:hypothetical protein